MCQRCGTLNRAAGSPIVRPATVAPPGPPTVVPPVEPPPEPEPERPTEAEPAAGTTAAPAAEPQTKPEPERTGEAAPADQVEPPTDQADGPTDAGVAASAEPRPGGGPLRGRMQASAPTAPSAVPTPQPFQSSVPAAAPHRRRTGRTAAIVALVLVLVGAAAGGAWLVLRDDDAPAPAAKGPTRSAGEQRLRDYQEHFCERPARPAEAGLLAAFEPGTPTVATIEMDQAPNVPGAAARQRFKVQVSPTLGTPEDAANAPVGQIRLATCVDRLETAATTITCRYRIDDGERRAKLVGTRFAVTVYDNSTGRKVTSGQLVTPTDSCPTKALLADDRVVSQPLTRAAVLAWWAAHFQGGTPS